MTTRLSGTEHERRAARLAHLVPCGALIFAALTAAAPQPVAAEHSTPPSQSADDTASDTHIHVVEQIQYPDVRAIGQDESGFIWFGINHQIEGGLIRFDGYSTRHYTHDLTDETSLSHNQVSITYFDRDQVLWVGTIRGGLNRYNADTDDFTRYLHDPEDDTTLPSDDIEAMIQASDGTYWVGTETGLARFDPDAGTATSFFHDPDDPNSLAGNRVRAIAEDTGTGQLWLGTSSGLSIFDPQTEEFHNYSTDPDDPRSIGDDAIEVIARDSEGVWWLGTDAGLARFDADTDDFTRFDVGDGPGESGESPTVTALLEDSQHRLWVGHSDGLSQFSRELGRPVTFADEPTLESVLNHSPVQALFEDVDGAIWVGTQTAGAVRISPYPKSVRYFRHDPDVPTSIGSDFVARVDATTDGLWLVTDAGVEFFDGTEFVDHTERFGLDGGWPSVHAVLAPSDDAIWLGFNDGRLATVDVVSGELTSYEVPAPADDAAIWPVAQATNGDIWYRVPWGFGVGVLRADGTSELLIGDDVDVDGDEPAYAFTTAHYFDAEAQVLWVTGLGLTRIDVKTGDVDVFSLVPDNPSAVANQLWSVDAGSDGHLWLASSNGIHEFDPTTGEYLGWMSDQLPAAGATDARFGPDGKLWIVAGPTLSGLDTDTGDVVVYSAGEEAGPNQRLAMENWVSSKFEVGSDGLMYAPTLDQGLVAFSPLELSTNTTPPRVVLTELSVFGEPVEAGSPTLPSPAHTASKISLAPDQNTFTLEFSALGYEHPEHNQYRYRLDGFDRDWRTTTAERRVATYTNVPSGSYTFRVEATNNSGVWAESGLAVAVIVATPWYETWWARSLALIGIGLAIIALFRWRTRHQRERNRQLEERLAERVRHQHERDLLLAQVNEHSERLQSILAAAPIGVVLLGREHQVLMKNKVAADEFAAFSKCTDDGKLLNFAGLGVEELAGSDRTGTWVTTTVDDHGNARSLSVSVRPIDQNDDRSPAAVPTSEPDSPIELLDRDHRDVGEGARGWVLLWDDITELEELQQRRARQDRLAAVGRFAAGIAHDVNNVLNVIGLNADLLHLDPQMSGQSREHVHQITRETGNASKFITQILDFSRQSVCDRQLLDAYSVVGTQVRQLAEVMQPDIDFEFFGHNPSTIWADPIQLERIVLNLVKNAQDAMGNSGTITVVVDHVPPSLSGIKPAVADPGGPAEWVRVAISDDGSGIAEDVLPTIFEPFVTTKPAGKGTGLGLAQVAGISAEHGGRVTVETELGAGTTVSVLFPAADPSEFDSVAELLGDRFAERGNGSRALVVDAEFLTPTVDRASTRRLR